MKIINTNTSYLMFLAYLIFTEFEILIMYCCCRPRLTSLFPKKALNKWIFRWKIHKDSSLFFLLFFPYFPLGPFVCLDFFFRFFLFYYFFLFIYFFFWWGGGLVGGLRAKGIVVLPGWFSLQGYYQVYCNGRWILGGGGRQFIITLLYIYQKRILHPDQNVTFKLWFWHLQSHEGQF